jgi:hypothetical protein
MTPSERATFTAAQRLFGSPETRLEAQRLLKKVDPTRHIPELDQHEQMEALREENRKLERRMEERVLRETVERRHAEQRRRLAEKGMDADRVEKIIVDYGIAGDDKEDAFTKAEKIYEMEQRSAESSAADIRAGLGTPAANVRPSDEWKNLDRSGLMQKSASMASDMIDQIRKGRMAPR